MKFGWRDKKSCRFLERTSGEVATWNTKEVGCTILRWLSEGEVVGVGGGWNWLRIMPRCRLLY
jgi:hypothetical protein